MKKQKEIISALSQKPDFQGSSSTSKYSPKIKPLILFPAFNCLSFTRNHPKCHLNLINYIEKQKLNLEIIKQIDLPSYIKKIINKHLSNKSIIFQHSQQKRINLNLSQINQLLLDALQQNTRIS
ncbi:hypothetical protein TTHERM_00424450 (macronuclear) [Tetrahymena thermophila SB210]|uniref:Uncharacterized protein n=1 Tax=Tetrahymena thermophila (strain SB210) TaxID=312017 RepID=Q23AL5_TETTS|nr:hypothetical protein TTHERM_00424450 [Tetrahymena thermophila SB210]EAR93477.1 hypothetical protein TTHERM_00424450 [Tetrahymena thermophila SB210]|eukprot:XP_001013722.1 hypothetical protein TTHERM_00424450 [Tetrahymena thermophila SB210]